MIAATLICWSLIVTPAMGQELYVQSMVAPIWTAPNRGASPVCVLAQGVKVHQVQEKEQWSLVRHKDRLGWILTMRLGKMNPRRESENGVTAYIVNGTTADKQILSQKKVVKRESRQALNDTQNQIRYMYEIALW